MMKFSLILPICVTIFSCSKNIVEDEIQENIESIEKKRNYEISLYSSIGGTISIEDGAQNTSYYLSLIHI